MPRGGITGIRLPKISFLKVVDYVRTQIWLENDPHEDGGEEMEEYRLNKLSIGIV